MQCGLKGVDVTFRSQVMSGLAALVFAAQFAAAESVPERRGTEFGFLVFQQHCSSCHGNPAYERAPSPAALRAMSPERIYDALTTGVMKPVGDTLTEEDRRRVSESLAGQLLGSAKGADAASMPNRCSKNEPLRAPGKGDWNGWGNGIHNERFQSATSGLNAASVPRLKLKWAFGYPGGTSAYGQPTVVSGRVFVGTDTGYVYSLDAASGCVYWSYRTDAGVRNAMTVGPIGAVGGGPAKGGADNGATTKGNPRLAVFFGDLKAKVYAIDAQTGAEIWKTRVEDNFATRVTAAPALYEGRLYVPISAWEGFQARVLDYPCCTAVGSVSALDANTGKRIWKTYTINEKPHPTRKNSKGVQLWGPAGVPVWNTPTIDSERHAVYVGTGDASTYPAPATSDAIMALNMDTGKVLWSQQIYKDDSFLVGCDEKGFTENCPKVVGPDWDIPMSPMLRTLADGRTLIVFGTKPGDIIALDPTKRGERVWSTNPADDPAAKRMLAPNGIGLRGPVWGGATDERTAYIGSSAGGLAAVSLGDGKLEWFTPLNSTPQKLITHTAAVTAIPGVVFVAGADGRLSAVSNEDGHALWSFETAKPFETVNKVQAHGGSIMSAGPTVGDGMVFVGSGYGVVSEQPGNVLLAFGVQ